MKIKKNDTVKIITGKDTGKTGKVLKVLRSAKSADKHRLVVDGLNLRYKHIRPKRSGEKGQRIMFPFAIAASSVALVCPKCNKTTRLRHKVLAHAPETSREKIQRICTKCGLVI